MVDSRPSRPAAAAREKAMTSEHDDKQRRAAQPPQTVPVSERHEAPAAAAHGTVEPAPAPSPWLLLAGLGAIGWLVGRRSRLGRRP
jgi:hypothetical protein